MVARDSCHHCNHSSNSNHGQLMLQILSKWTKICTVYRGWNKTLSNALQTILLVCCSILSHVGSIPNITGLCMIVLYSVCTAFLTSVHMHIFNRQYMLSSGTGYDSYGLILSSATLVPLQGFWNSFVYIRPRYARDIVSGITSSFARATLSQRSKSSHVAPPPTCASLQPWSINRDISSAVAKSSEFVPSCLHIPITIKKSRTGEFNYE